MNNYRPDVDGLRSVAVLGVLFFHAFPNSFAGGFIGVDIFFVISGFLITGIILDHIRNNSFTFSDFYSRRIKRIFPALLLVLTGTLLVGWLMLLPHEFRQLGKHIMGGIGFTSNLVLWKESGYFDLSTDLKPLLHLWSLGIEEQFYFVWPLLLVFMHKGKLGFYKVVSVLFLLSFAVNILAISSHPTLTFYAPITRFWEFLVGGALAHCIRGPQSYSKYKNVTAFLGLLLLILGFALLNKTRMFPGWWATLPTFGAALLIGAGPQTWINKKILSHPLMVGIGLISYPLYLWHWPLLSFLNILDAKEPHTLLRWLLLLASVGLAWLTYLLIERKARRQSNAFAKPLFLFGCGILLFGFLVWKDFIVSRSAFDKNLAQISQAYDDWRFPGSFVRTGFEDGHVFVKGTGKKKTLFIGDSHMEQFLPRIEKILSTDALNDRTAVFSTGQGCPPIPLVYKKQFEHCEGFLKRSLNYAFREEVDAVVITGAWLFHTQNPKTFIFNDASKDFLNNNPIALDRAFLNLEVFVKDLRSKNKSVFLISDIPDGDEFDPRSLLDRAIFKISIKDNLGSSKNDLIKKYEYPTKKLKEISVRTGAVFIDPLDSMCGSEFCNSADDSVPRYKDAGHIRASYAENHLDFLDQTMALSRLAQ